MLFSENIYFLILFTLPAALNTIYNSHIRQVPVAKNDKSVELAECIIFCLAVFCVNIFIMHEDMLLFSQYATLSGEKLETFVTTSHFNYIDFLIKYCVINIFSSIGIIAFWYLIGQAIFRWTQNKMNALLKRPTEYKFSDVWSNVFETSQIVDIDNCIIKIERSGNLVTAGLIKLYSAPNQPSKEFVLYNTDLIKQLFEDDSKKNLKKRMFQQTLCEYYDVQNDLLIKFYDTENYDKEYALEE